MPLSRTRDTRKGHKERVAARKKRLQKEMLDFYKKEQKRINEAMMKYQESLDNNEEEE